MTVPLTAYPANARDFLFDPGSGLPVVLANGTSFTDQATFDNVAAKAAASGVRLRVSPAPGTAFTPPKGAPVYDASVTANRRALRARDDRRAVKTLCTDDVTVTNAASADAALTKSYAWPISGISSGQSRVLTQAELDACPIDLGLPVARAPHSVNNASGFGYGFLPASATAPTPQQLPRRYRFWTNATKVQVLLFRSQGAAINGHRVVVNGRPYTLRPQAGTSTLEFLTLVFTDPTVPNLVEVYTSAYFGGVSWSANHDIWKPKLAAADTEYFLGDSFGVVTYNDNGSGTAINEDIAWYESEVFSGNEVSLLDCIGGTGWTIRVSSTFQSPNNSWVDRLPALLMANPDVLMHPTLAANDIFVRNNAGAGTPTDAQIIAAMLAVWGPYRAQNPNGRIIVGNGLLTPAFRPYAAQFAALATSVLSACASIGIYVIDTAGWLTGTGDTGNLKADGNCDWAVGPDHTHPTSLGAQYLRRRWAHAKNRVMADDGSLVNTIIAA